MSTLNPETGLLQRPPSSGNCFEQYKYSKLGSMKPFNFAHTPQHVVATSSTETKSQLDSSTTRSDESSSTAEGHQNLETPLNTSNLQHHRPHSYSVNHAEVPTTNKAAPPTPKSLPQSNSNQPNGEIVKNRNNQTETSKSGNLNRNGQTGHLISHQNDANVTHEPSVVETNGDQAPSREPPSRAQDTESRIEHEHAQDTQQSKDVDCHNIEPGGFTSENPEPSTSRKTSMPPQTRDEPAPAPNSSTRITAHGKVQKPHTSSKHSTQGRPPSRSSSPYNTADIVKILGHKLEEEQRASAQVSDSKLLAQQNVIDDLRSRSQSLENTIQKLKQENESLCQTSEEHQQRLTKCLDKIKGFQSYMHDVEKDLKRMNNENISFSKLLNEMREDHEKEITDMRNKFDTSETFSQSILQSYKRICSQTVDAIQDDLAWTATRKDDLEQQLNETKGLLSEERHRVINLEQQLHNKTAKNQENLERIIEECKTFVGERLVALTSLLNVQHQSQPTQSYFDETLHLLKELNNEALGAKDDSFELQYSIDEISGKLSATDCRIQELEKSRAEGEETIEALLKDQLEGMKADFLDTSKLRKQMEDMSKHNAVLESQHAAQNMTIQENKKEVAALQAKKAITEAEMQNLKSHLQNAEEKANSKDEFESEFRKVQALNVELNDDIERVRTELEECLFDRGEVMTDLSYTKAELKKAKERIKELEPIITDMKDQASKSEESIRQDCQKSLDQIRSSMQFEHQNEMRQMNHAKRKLEQDLELANQQLDDMKAQVKTLQETVDSRDASTQMLCDQVEQLGYAADRTGDTQITYGDENSKAMADDQRYIGATTFQPSVQANKKEKRKVNCHVKGAEISQTSVNSQVLDPSASQIQCQESQMTTEADMQQENFRGQSIDGLFGYSADETIPETQWIEKGNECQSQETCQTPLKDTTLTSTSPLTEPEESLLISSSDPKFMSPKVPATRSATKEAVAKAEALARNAEGDRCNQITAFSSTNDLKRPLATSQNIQPESNKKSKRSNQNGDISRFWAQASSPSPLPSSTSFPLNSTSRNAKLDPKASQKNADCIQPQPIKGKPKNVSSGNQAKATTNSKKPAQKKSSKK